MICDNALDIGDIRNGILELAGLNVALTIDMYFGSSTAIEELAKYKFMIDKYISLKEKLQENFKTALLCELFTRYKYDEELETVVVEIEKILTAFGELDQKVTNVNYSTFEDLESSIDVIVENFETEKNKIKVKVDEKLKDVFSILVELGASQQEIDQAFKDIEFNANPLEYMQDVFMQLLDITLTRLEDEN